MIQYHLPAKVAIACTHHHCINPNPYFWALFQKSIEIFNDSYCQL